MSLIDDRHVRTAVTAFNDLEQIWVEIMDENPSVLFTCDGLDKNSLSRRYYAKWLSADGQLWTVQSLKLISYVEKDQN